MEFAAALSNSWPALHSRHFELTVLPGAGPISAVLHARAEQLPQPHHFRFNGNRFHAMRPSGRFFPFSFFLSAVGRLFLSLMFPPTPRNFHREENLTALQSLQCAPSNVN